MRRRSLGRWCLASLPFVAAGSAASYTEAATVDVQAHPVTYGMIILGGNMLLIGAGLVYAEAAYALNQAHRSEDPGDCSRSIAYQRQLELSQIRDKDGKG